MLVVLEVLLRIFWAGGRDARHNPLDAKFESLRIAMKQAPKFYQDRFCDSVHQNKFGEKNVAACILKDIKDFSQAKEKNYINALTVGASTTRGNNCDSETSWPSELSRYDSRFKILNLADDGAYSDESIIRIEKELEKKNIPDQLIWAHGFSELLFYGDERDINWATLNRDQILMETLRKDGVYKENTIISILRFDLTLQKYAFLYKFLRTKFNLALISIKNGYSEFVLTLEPSAENQTSARENFTISSGFLGGPVRMIFSEPTQNYAINNYRLNLQRLSDLSQKYKFKVVCVKLPFVRGLLNYFSNEFGKNYDNWMEKIAVVTEEQCRIHGFAISDAEKCYQDQFEKEK